jgi:hypothetical protein
MKMKTDRFITHKRLASVLAMATLAGAAQAATLHVPADYLTIQAAVDAAAPEGDEILVAPGVYQQQVFITGKKLTITGSAGTILEAWTGMYWKPDAPFYAVVEIRKDADVVIRNIEFDGKRLAQSMPNRNAILVGLQLTGASGRVENCVIKGFRGTSRLASATTEPLGGQGYGLASVSTLLGAGSGVKHVQILNNTFSDNGRSIILCGDIDGDLTSLRTTFVIEGNTIQGVGPTSMDFQIGIAIRGGVTGVIKRNRITDHYHTNPNGYTSRAISASEQPSSLQPLHIEANQFVGNQRAALLVLADKTRIINNVFQGSEFAHSCVGMKLTGADIQISMNRFTQLDAGVVLANEWEMGTGSGVAVNPALLANQFYDVTTPVTVQTGVINASELGSEYFPEVYGDLTCSPATGLPGTTVTLSGTALASASTVLFNGQSAEFISGADPDNEIVATVPAHATTGPIVVITTLQGNLRSMDPFTVPVLLGMAQPGNDTIELSWSADACDLLLECTSSLATPDWQTMPTSPSVGNEVVTWTGSLADGAQFFRLRQP